MSTHRFTAKPLNVPDTGPSRLPGLGTPPATGNAALDAWLRHASEHIEVRGGARGNPYDRAVTVREFQAVAETAQKISTPKLPGPGEVQMDLGGFTATVAIEQFAEKLKATRLYRDLIKRLDDPSRFDELPGEVRKLLLADLAAEAAKRGAEVMRLEKVMEDQHRSLSYAVQTLTAAVGQSQAAVREVTWATGEMNRAQAGQITQLVASLGNFYQDGRPGRVQLEQQMTATADRLTGLSGQYTLKINAGGAVAGFGLAATDNNGAPSSAMIIAADKFAIVNPSTYTGGLTNTPDTAHIPFGVDSSGIYLNNNVYVRGLMRVDTNGRTLADGLRGSVDLNGGSGSWNDNAASARVWQYLGNTGNPPNTNHLVIGDSVTIGTATRQWNGTAWAHPGVVINGDMLVNGSVAADKINTNGLIVRDAWGTPILGAGVPIPASYLTNATANITNNSSTTRVTVNGQPMLVSDFVNRLSRITSTNIGTFMESAAIGSAYIGHAAVGTLQVAGGAVTTMRMSTGGGFILAPRQERAVAAVSLRLARGSTGVVVMGFVNCMPLDGNAGLSVVPRWRHPFSAAWHQAAFSAVSMHRGFRTFNGVFGFVAGAQLDDGAELDLLLQNLDYTSRVEVLECTLVCTGGLR